MKKCKNCHTELFRKSWIGKRKRIESNLRWNKRIYCGNTCRSKALSKQRPEDNYFYGKHLIPWNKGKRSSNGWKVKDERGYIRIYSENGKWEYEHRIIAKSIMGALSYDEIVHHINWKKEDNRPENLLICTRGEHYKYHKKRYESKT